VDLQEGNGLGRRGGGTNRKVELLPTAVFVFPVHSVGGEENKQKTGAKKPTRIAVKANFGSPKKKKKK